MKNIIFVTLLFAVNFFYAQQNWGYIGKESPEHWSEMEGNENCGQSKTQSPIDIINSKTIVKKEDNNIVFHYKNSCIKDIVDTRNSLQFDFKCGGHVTYNNKKFFLIQFHAHEESEHTIDGIRYPLELHFVHKNLDNSVFVISTMVKEGHENSSFEKLKVFKTISEKTKIETKIKFDPERMYPRNKSYYTYSGSLTTPPCSDNVTWIVFKNPIEMTKEEIEEIGKHLPKMNNRPIQPLNGRSVFQITNIGSKKGI
jgi:carbonic anhydrase